ncbi:MAG: glycerol-3-phosphate 1-O-acyltransferase PlsY [Granulosicoccus sp.]
MFAAELALPALITAVLSYLTGSVSAAILVCRAMGLEDPRSAGSGNPGATNVLRVGGKLPAALTLLGDGLKGFLPVLVTSLMTSHPPTLALAAIAAFIGHLYPVFFQFQGGKGVATALGALLGISLSVGALALLTWLAVSLTFKRSSLAALVTFVVVPVYLLFDAQQTSALAFVFIAGFLFYTHRSNISRLIDGTEPVIGKR